MRYCYCEAKVRSSSVSVVYVVRLRIIFSKAALQKRGSTEPIEPPLDPPLHAHHCMYSGVKMKMESGSDTQVLFPPSPLLISPRDPKLN